MQRNKVVAVVTADFHVSGDEVEGCIAPIGVGVLSYTSSLLEGEDDRGVGLIVDVLDTSSGRIVQWLMLIVCGTLVFCTPENEFGRVVTFRMCCPRASNNLVCGSGICVLSAVSINLQLPQDTKKSHQNREGDLRRG